MTDEAALAREYLDLKQQERRLLKRLDEVGDALKQRKGERQVGPYLVNVAAFITERVDLEAVRALLGDRTPTKASATVRLTVQFAGDDAGTPLSPVAAPTGNGEVAKGPEGSA